MQRQNPTGGQPNHDAPRPEGRIIKRDTSARSEDVQPGSLLPEPSVSPERPKGLQLPTRHGQDQPLTAAQAETQAPPPGEPEPAVTPEAESARPPHDLDQPVGDLPPPKSPSIYDVAPPAPQQAAVHHGRRQPMSGGTHGRDALGEAEPAPAPLANPAALGLAPANPEARQAAEKPKVPAPDPAPSLVQTTASPRHQLEAWLAMMVQKEASDLILRAGGRPCVRVDGRIHFMPGRVPGPGALLEVLEGIVGKTRMKTWAEIGSADVALDLDALGRFRLNAYRQMGDPAVVLRRIAEDPPELESLNLPTRDLQQIAHKKRGIVLVTGIAGSGKSTTLAAMIQYMNQNTERHIITLEDPVEMIFTEDRCVISQREVGTDCSDFSEGLRHSLRQSPDVILIGEMRDAETINAALDATETGHLVMSTLHTVNAPQTVDRILSFFRAEQHAQVRQRLAENLVGVLSQRLLPFTNGAGMVPAVELMSSTPRVRELLEGGRTAELSRVIDQGGEEGLISFNQSLRVLVTTGCVDLETALAASDKPDELLLALRGFSSGGERRGPGVQSSGGGYRMASGE